MSLCYVEKIEGESHVFDVKSVVFDVKTKFQHAVCVDSILYGKILFLDGASQSSEVDEHIYHEMLVHPVMSGMRSDISVLIIGGGEGATLREVLRYPGVSSVTMVDIDEELVKLCQEHMPEWADTHIWNDRRARIVYQDIWDFFSECKEKYDVVVVDLVDPDDDVVGGDVMSPGENIAKCRGFYSVYFLREIKKVMRDMDSQVVMQVGEYRPFDHGEIEKMSRLFRRVFGSAESYKIFVPVYQGEWGFVRTAGGMRKNTAGTRFYDHKRYDGAVIKSWVEINASEDSEDKWDKEGDTRFK